MPLYEFMCVHCGVTEMFFPHVDTKTEIAACKTCGAKARRIPSVPAFTEFVPFTTNHILPDGSPVHVRDRSQLRSLLREHKLVELGNDPVRSFFGNSEKSIPRSGTKSSKQKRAKSNAVPETQAKRSEEFARRTDFGHRSL